ncbi:MAG: deoxyribodipyrimidine photo-lyase [Pseudolabrys sp.]
MSAPIIVWFRDDLRLHDHPALTAAAEAGEPLVCLYVLDETSGRPLGGASRWWLAQSLRALDASLKRLGQRLLLRRGNATSIIPRLARETRARAVIWNRAADPESDARDRDVETALHATGVEATVLRANLLAQPGEITAKDGGPVRVFTPYWRRVRALGTLPLPLAAPKRLSPAPRIESERLEDWNLEPSTPDWAGGLRDNWTPGENAARARLADFLDTANGYAGNRDRPDLPATSRLSPHLRFGEVSAREVFHAAQTAAEQDRAPRRDVEKFHSELGWRDFSYQLLRHHPTLATANFQPRFDAFPWLDDEPALRAWQRGRTGYPVVDAGMRELWTTGWMHNRVRMIVASFLVKHLLIDWRHGEQWFWDTLVDADPANNPANWQWVAGCGADAAPYFRIFNPVLQGEKFDPDGDYVRRWVPELATLPNKLIHSPWAATPLELAGASVELGKHYPAPIVDHAAARQRALDAFRTTKSG